MCAASGWLSMTVSSKNWRNNQFLLALEGSVRKRTTSCCPLLKALNSPCWRCPLTLFQLQLSLALLDFISCLLLANLHVSETGKCQLTCPPCMYYFDLSRPFDNLRWFHYQLVNNDSVGRPSFNPIASVGKPRASLFDGIRLGAEGQFSSLDTMRLDKMTKGQRWIFIRRCNRIA